MFFYLYYLRSDFTIFMIFVVFLTYSHTSLIRNTNFRHLAGIIIVEGHVICDMVLVLVLSALIKNQSKIVFF